ncbi:hypothetical protein D4764_20G0008980 [Takifugu flavidus]|uniref:Uncharacterized protein n=1 Tax=Takifugu flavidus TaxID=433684 RepID=A0A5C6NIF0_9TELE|nr:hypothetical protein D4764_20G0008980 [Takifugu flavidus]
MGNHTSSHPLNTEAPQRCVLSSLLYTLYTYGCSNTTEDNIVKFSDKMARTWYRCLQAPTERMRMSSFP